MTDWVDIIGKAFWSGWAAVGFGILFNVSPRALFPIWLGGAITGLVKFTVLLLSAGNLIVLGSFLASIAVGLLSIPFAHWRHIPPMIFAIPSVIPLMPGVFAYRTMLGLMKLTEAMRADYMQVLSDTIHNGLVSVFIVMALATGVATPMHILRKESVKKIGLKK